MARISSRKAKLIESPRHGMVIKLRRPANASAPPVIRIKKTATAQIMMASVSSQPEIRCQAGSEKRKKLSGLPKIGSTTLPMARGAYQKSASVGHSPIMPAPVTKAIMADPPNPRSRITGSTGSFTGCPPTKTV